MSVKFASPPPITRMKKSSLFILFLISTFTCLVFTENLQDNEPPSDNNYSGSSSSSTGSLTSVSRTTVIEQTTTTSQSSTSSSSTTTVSSDTSSSSSLSSSSSSLRGNYGTTNKNPSVRSTENKFFTEEINRLLQTTGPAIVYPTYAEGVRDIQNLGIHYPDIVQVWNAQDRYGVPSPVTPCRVDGETRGPCKHWFLTITNRTTLKDSSITSSVHEKDRPQVFFSGNLHGDEKVGPITLFTLAHLLVESSQESSPNYNSWLRQLINTRIIVMIPMTNPLGYDRHVRTEDGVDPNRDFPYAELPENCMITATARALNEVWREHLFQLAVTFHGGMQAISYEWGSPNHEASNSESPDDSAQLFLALIMREMAGKFLNNAYPVGRMNQLVYPVSGGMEDWAYAASWDRGADTICKPHSFGGYPVEKMQYNNAQLRAINVLVETWDDKTPPINQLGIANPQSMLLVEGPGDGHGPRNVRLALSVIDLVQPYVTVTKKLGYIHTETVKHSVEVSQFSQSKNGETYVPGLCIPLNITRSLQGSSSINGGVNDCGTFKQQYDIWNTVFTELSVPNSTVSGSGSGAPLSITETEAESSFWIGWDVGGAVKVDRTSAIIAPWDPRVPPELFSKVRPVVSSTGQIGEVTTADPNAYTADDNFISTLLTVYGFGTRSEAESFAIRLHYLQLFTNGRIPFEALPTNMYLRANKEILSGTTRWSFGQVGSVMTPILLPEERNPNAPVSPVKDSPDLVYNPYLTRFSSCFRLATNGITASLEGLSPNSLYDCHHDDMDTENHHRQRQRRRELSTVSVPRSVVDYTIDTSTYVSEFQSAVRSFIILPYAKVDKDFTKQNNPEPMNVLPQSHWVNARTNPSWNMENNIYRVQGKHQYVSKPVFVAVETRSSWDLSSLTPSNGNSGETSGISPTPSPSRIPHISHTSAPTFIDSTTTHENNDGNAISSLDVFKAFLIALAITCTIGGCAVCLQFIRIRYLERKAERIEDEIVRSSFNRTTFFKQNNNNNENNKKTTSSSSSVAHGTNTVSSNTVHRQGWTPQIDIDDDDENNEVSPADIVIEDDFTESEITTSKKVVGESV